MHLLCQYLLLFISQTVPNIVKRLLRKVSDYDRNELRELFILDPRINASHTFVSETRPYWDSHCLNKDVPAITETYDADMLKGIIAYNEQQKAKYQSHF